METWNHVVRFSSGLTVGRYIVGLSCHVNTRSSIAGKKTILECFSSIKVSFRLIYGPVFSSALHTWQNSSFNRTRWINEEIKAFIQFSPQTATYMLLLVWLLYISTALNLKQFQRCRVRVLGLECENTMRKFEIGKRCSWSDTNH